MKRAERERTVTIMLLALWLRCDASGDVNERIANVRKNEMYRLFARSVNKMQLVSLHSISILYTYAEVFLPFFCYDPTM